MKYLVVIANGLTDRPIAEKENKTPLQIADTPNLDRMVQEGYSGSVQTIPENCKAGNEISYLSLLGYDPEKHDIGPAYFDTLAIGLNLKEGEIPLCCNFVTLQASHNDMVMKDYTADHLSSEESINYLNALQTQISDFGVTFYPGVGPHNIMVMNSKPFTIRLTSPNELIGEGIRKFMPVDAEFKDLIYIINQAQIILHNHPVNKKRKLESLDYANSIWLWGNGKNGTLPSFKKKYGKSGSLISASLLFQGMAKSADMRVVKVEGASGFAETNYENKVKAAIQELESQEIVYLNVAGIEDISLKGNIDDKIITIEDIDSKVIGPLLKETFSNNEIKMMVVVNHMNSAVDVKYGKDRVPFVMSGKNDTNLVNNFDENLLNVGNNHFKSGSDLMSMFFDLN
ncbi:MAG: phosphoglycerate mutase [Nitrospina sp.]|jgi:2,3-bisphosphoglycerate-independent phosphoglycerate mutase|nr:phosphoglycerate mutase [Nitrospina sp.]MBT6295970.1 phosphoglycerate mutase [Nitrospina sp.]|tara:strand:- start:2715 stop:3911 length:1197 start_codon:yes stop_codon:yes gene_type:complete